jgi:hypothetical protein
MRAPLVVGIVVVAALTASAAPRVADAATVSTLPARALATAPPAVQLIARDGFGDDRNVYSWSMARFRGKIYVGTGRMVACVENFTADFYLVVSFKYVREPYPGAYCPPNAYDMDLRAEIWEYTPRTGRWRRAYRSPADVPNPRARGKFVARDIAFRGMTVYRDARGHERLYVGGVTADEYLPELKLGHPPRILSTADGRRFRATPARKLIVRMPYGTYRPIGFRSMRVWRGTMFVTLTPGLTGDGGIFEVTRPWSPRRARFRQVSPKTMAVFETQVFNGHLYAGTGNFKRGYGVYKATRRGSGYRFRPLVTDGAGRGGDLTSVVSMEVFKDRLYVGSSGWWDEQLPVSELIRIDRSGAWQVVAGKARIADGQVRVPISGLGDGFNNMFSAHFWRMGTYRGALVVGNNDWAFLVRTAYPSLKPWEIGVVESVIKPEAGFDLWSSCDGRDWAPITRDAFGGNAFDFGARNIVTAGSQLFVGSANHSEGTKVWKYRGRSCVASGSARPATPRRLLTDVQRGGTVVSWRRSATQLPGTRYHVLRADYETLRLGLSAPPTQANGFRLEGQLPLLSAPGTGATRPVELPVMARFRTVGSTRRQFFVDRTARPGQQYGYRVRAETPSGARSVPSNLQVVPDPRPAPTVEEVMRKAGGRAPRGMATMAIAARSRRARQGTLRALAEMERRTGRDADLQDLIERVRRRIRYAGIAAAGLK